MNICLVTPYFLPQLSGTEINVNEISKVLNSLGNKVSILTPRYDNKLPKYENNNGILVYRFSAGKIIMNLPSPLRSFFLSLNVFGLLIRLNSKNKIHIVHQFHLYNLGLGVIMFKLFLRVPVVTTLSGWDTYSPTFQMPKIVFPYLAWIMNNSDRIIVLAEKVLAYAYKQGLKHERVSIIYPGVDVLSFTKNDLNSQKLLTEKLVIICIQRLVPLKNVEHIIKSFVKVKNNFPGASLRIVGDGPQREELEDEVVRSNASDIFFLGRLSREETIKQYKNADIFVSASKFETGGTTFIEAMAAGLPIVTTPVGASVEIMKEKINCFFVEIGDSDEMSKKIEILSKDPQIRQDMSQNNFKLAPSFDWTEIVNQHKNVYMSIVNKQ